MTFRELVKGAVSKETVILRRWESITVNRKLVPVKSFKADVSRVSPLSERMAKG